MITNDERQNLKHQMDEEYRARYRTEVEDEMRAHEPDFQQEPGYKRRAFRTQLRQEIRTGTAYQGPRPVRAQSQLSFPPQSPAGLFRGNGSASGRSDNWRGTLLTRNSRGSAGRFRPPSLSKEWIFDPLLRGTYAPKCICGYILPTLNQETNLNQESAKLPFRFWIGSNHFKKLQTIREKTGCPVAESIRRAIAVYLQQQAKEQQ